MDPYRSLLCPVCRAPLHREGRSLYCAGPGKVHCYDLAASGYVNLNAPGKAGNTHTGDDKEMIRARNRFLSRGYYDAIGDTCALLLSDFVRSGETFCLTDAGCGEGYHTLRMASRLQERTSVPVFAHGFDASKTGADAAARRAGKLAGDAVTAVFCAANLFDLPLKDASQNAVVSLFAPIAAEESARVLDKDGLMLVGASGKKHLWELREQLYDTPRLSGGEIRTPAGFEKVGAYHLSQSVSISSQEDLWCLFQMTPFYYKTSPRDAEKLRALSSLRVTLEVEFALFKKCQGGCESC